MASSRHKNLNKTNSPVDPWIKDDDIYEQLKKKRHGKSVGPNTYYVIQMVDAGFSVREIAQDLGISTQRVYQILWREGKEAPTRGPKQTGKKKKGSEGPPKPVRHDPDN